MPKYDLKLFEGRLVIDMGYNENDVLVAFGYTGVPEKFDICELGPAEIIGTIELNQQQLEKIQSEYKNGGECDYCEESAKKLRPSPFLGDAGAKMCKHCWEMTQKEYAASHDEHIGDFEEYPHFK